MPAKTSPEGERLEEANARRQPWRKWGPYVSERQWGTVREDYSADGDAWNYLPHDHARSRAYRWGEDGLAGFCDIEQRLCVAVALWNGRFRDTMPDWWRSHDGLLPDFATRLCGSADIYDRPDEGADPSASVNFVTVHDGFTLNDLVSYDGKHNEANTENNRDGTDDNRSWNCGAEGSTADADVNA